MQLFTWSQKTSQCITLPPVCLRWSQSEYPNFSKCKHPKTHCDIPESFAVWYLKNCLVGNICEDAWENERPGMLQIRLGYQSLRCSHVKASAYCISTEHLTKALIGQTARMSMLNLDHSYILQMFIDSGNVRLQQILILKMLYMYVMVLINIV